MCLLFKKLKSAFTSSRIRSSNLVALIKPWATQFGLCAMFTMISTLVFLTGVCSYKYVRPGGSSMTIIFRVLFASFTKMLYRRPSNVADLYEKPGLLDDYSVPHSKGLRCLDKAAVVLPQPPLEQQEQQRWRLCTVTEIKSTKIVIRMIPMWLTFILCGLVSSIGDTYFLIQANQLNRKLGHFKIPLVFLLWFYNQSKQAFTKLFITISNSFVDNPEERRYVPPAGIAVAMVFSILCCITAAKVESKRLGVVQSHGLIEKPDEKIPMSVLWLIPQFALLGALDGIQSISVANFVTDQAPASMVRYLLTFSRGVYGIGIIGSAVSVYIVGKISSKKDGNKNWFQSTLNKSRLDNYYWVLAVLCVVNLLLYVVIAVLFFTRIVMLMS